jgi:phage tail P2-like protein
MAGSSVLYNEATGLERALVDVGMEALGKINGRLILENWDPALVQTANLGTLAWGLGAQLWRDEWPEVVKRKWTASQSTFLSLRGTITAIDMAIAIQNEGLGSEGTIELLQVARPPQAMYWGGSVPKEIWDAYLKLLPEIRIYSSRQPALVDGVYFGDGFWSADHFAAERSLRLSGRRASLYRDGTITPLPLFTQEDASPVMGSPFTSETAQIPSDAGLGLFYGDGFYGSEFTGGNPPVEYVTYRLVRDQGYYASPFQTTAVLKGLVPMTPRYERASESKDAGLAAFWGDAEWGGGQYLETDEGWRMMFDRLRLFDPSVSAPLGTGGDFWSDARFGMPAKYMELMLRVARPLHQPEAVWTDSFFGASYLTGSDLTLVDLAFKAVEAAKALRDTIMVSLDTTRPLTFGDAPLLNGSVTLATRTRRYL